MLILLRIPLTSQRTQGSWNPSQPHVVYLRSDCHCIGHPTMATLSIRLSLHRSSNHGHSQYQNIIASVIQPQPISVSDCHCIGHSTTATLSIRLSLHRSFNHGHSQYQTVIASVIQPWALSVSDGRICSDRSTQGDTSTPWHHTISSRPTS